MLRRYVREEILTMASRKDELDMTEAPFIKKLIIFAIPVILTGLLQCFYNAADTAVVGSLRGEIALAAVGSTGALNGAIVNLFMGLSVGAGVVVARAIGAKNEKSVEKAIHSSVLLGLILGVIVGILGIIFARPLLVLMDTPESVIGLSTLYMQINFTAMPASLIYNYCAAIMRSNGNTKKPLYFLLISGAVNVLLNLLFVGAFGMSVDGVALATVISQYLSAALILSYMAKSEGVLKFSFKKLCLDSSSIKNILAIGVPSGIQTTLFALSNVMIQSSVNSFGEITMAGNTAASNLESFIHTAMVSIYHAALAFVGQNMGAKKYTNIKKIVFSCVLLSASIGVLVSALILILRGPLLSLYTDNSEVVKWAVYRMLFMLPAYPFCGIMDATSASLRAMGRSVNAMINALVGACAFRIIWVKLIFNFVERDIGWIYLAFGISYLIGIALNAIFIIRTYKKLPKSESLSTVTEGAQSAV